MLPFNTASLLFSIACNLQLPLLLRCFLRFFVNNPPIVLFCHRILPPKYEFSELDEFYHRLGHPTVEEFESQLRYLSSYHSIVSLEEVVDFVLDGKRLPSSPVVLTFDDGYHDNFSLAFPVLRDYQCKAGFFLTTDFIGTGEIPFHDQIIYGLCYTKEKKVRMEDDNGRHHEYFLGTLNNKIRSFFKIQKLFKTLPYHKRTTYIKKLLTELEVEIDKTFLNHFMLSWEEIETMYLAGYTFCSHTQSHPLLTKLNTKELENEIIESNNIIFEKLKSEGIFFCYPYGKKGEFDKRIIHLLRDNGFIAACSAIHGINRQGDDPYRIKRTAMISEPIEAFSLRTAGLFEIVMGLQARLK